MIRSPKRIHLSAPHLSGREERYVREAFSSNWLSTVGPNLTNLEQEFSARVGLPSVALASGTAGIHLGVKLLEVKPGDEVIVSTLTFAASCNPSSTSTANRSSWIARQPPGISTLNCCRTF